MKYLIDAYAWIEYLEGSKLGEKVREIMVGKDDLFSLSLTISEVISKVKRKNGNTDLAYKAITSNSKILNISPEIAKQAGLFHAEMRKKIENFGLVDSLLLALARELKAKILTGNHHFKNFKEAIFINQNQKRKK